MTRKEEVFERVEKSILDFDGDKAVEVAKEAINSGVEPVEVIERGVRKALETVGKKYETGELFIIHLAAAGEAANRAINEVLKPEIEKKGEEIHFTGKVLIGTVAGDIHEIGKTIVSAMLLASGFEVTDLGKDVPIETFVREVKEQNPDILGMSALLSTTIPVQKDVIEALQKEGLRDKVKVMVGGAPVTQEWAEEIGADAYGVDAVDAMKKARKLVGA
ncbi:MAG: Methyltransferase corrinoid protein [Candidatus Methanolliviera sp. GoM_oil]|nr:MAG: Methyltransferase corrinoid protein [Candidatus Methanolliviera sp. GoM_oil]